MRVFISYRRSDTQHLAGRIADRLRDDKDITEVFLDVDGILPGEDFAAKIEMAIAECSVCLILIGPNWLGRESVRFRILDEHDFIRLETGAALTSGRKVIPVLVENTSMPLADDLPEDLKQLPRLNGISVSHHHFNKDMESLLEGIHGRENASGRQSVSSLHTFVGHFMRAFIGLFFAVVALIGVAIAHNLATGGRSLDESFGSGALVLLMIFGTLALGAFTPSAVRWLRKRRR